MRTLCRISCLVAVLLAGSEIARWWGNPRMLPLAIDELTVAGALLASAAVARRSGTTPLAAAWGLYCGLMLALIVPTLDHLLHGPPKSSAAFYTVILAAMLALGIWATVRALALTREPSNAR